MRLSERVSLIIHAFSDDYRRGMLRKLVRDVEAMEDQHRAELLAFGERVREACRKATLSMEVEPLDHAEAVYAVDVARLLDGEGT